MRGQGSASNGEQVTFARALVSLFESREAALASFHRVIERNPDGPLVSSSHLWLQIIDYRHGSPPQRKQVRIHDQVVAQLLRDWMVGRGPAGFQPPAVREQPMDQSRDQRHAQTVART